MTARKWWKMYYRAMRIARREALKATQDMMLYGTGVVYVGEDAKPDGIAQHIPIEQYGIHPFMESLAAAKELTNVWKSLAEGLNKQEPR